MGLLSEVVLSQPEWWVLHQLSPFPGGVGRDEVIDKLGHNDTPQAIVAAIAISVAKGSVHEFDSTLKSTTQGNELFRQGLKVQEMLQDERMLGVSEADYVVTIEVLQRIIKNVGPEVWHW